MLNERLLTAPEVAKLLNVEVATIYAWAQRRQIPFQKVGRVLRFDPLKLEQWLADQAWPPGEELVQHPVRGPNVGKGRADD